MALPVDRREGPVVNIDHHRDNSGFGDVVLLRVEASSTCEIVCDIARALALEPGPQAAAALYAGLSFDSGHFRHSKYDGARPLGVRRGSVSWAST